MIVKKADYISIPSIGIVMHIFEDFLIASKSEKNNIERMNIDIKKYYIESPIVSPYFIEHDNKIIISSNAPEELKNILKNHFDIIEIDFIENLIGNIFLIGKNGIIYSYGKDSDVKKISEKLSLPAYKIKTKYLFGSISKLYNNKLLISQELNDKIIEKVKEITGYNLDIGSINFGSPYLRYGIEINKEYLIIGKYSTGHEIVKVEEFFS
ncbi:translation initiation factor 6 (aeIF-6) [Candidatus Nanobsidianus stetteri]|uniref:Translation initiation factor 6 (AeIF-6) n=1 Tax=Nanobsidianus stetteri TaxID=1294122 RepID=R1G3T5_NANST|nr:translation initiation factor 6 (aeIF-6) [Candidatus Nanobsidianus stetteri]